METIRQKVEREQVLSVPEELALLKSGDKKLIQLYMWWNFLSDEAQMFLMQMKDVGLIRYYVGKDPLIAAAEVELVKLADLKLLDFYITAHGLGPQATKIILDSNDKSLLRVYRKRR